MTAALDVTLKELLANCSSAFWAGSQPPLAWMNASALIYDPASDYRLPSPFHQKFDLVYLVERDLGHVKAWPLVVDEALRLLAPGGVLAIRASNTNLLSVFELKNLLLAWGQRALEPLFEHAHEDGIVQFGVRNMLRERRPAGLAAFSFGVITDGKRPELLKDFITSAQSVERNSGEAIEILVCGPSSLKPGLDALGEQVVLVQEPDSFTTQGWITRKKNLLVRAARHENVVIAHDRYIIPKDFITRLREFGGDFSVLVCRQVRPDGRRIPDWVAMGSEWTMTTPATLEYGDWSRNLYVNGGLMIAKTSVLRDTGWNELLFWGQAEDVELTRRLRAHGHIPRLARNLTATSQLPRPGFIEAFEAYPAMPDRHWVTGPPGVNGEQILPNLAFDRSVMFGAEREGKAANLGVCCDSEWRLDVNAIRLRPGIYGEITFRLAQHPQGAVEIVLEAVDAGQKLEALVNDTAVPCARDDAGRLRLDVPAAVFRFNAIARLHLRNERAELAVYSMTVSMAGSRSANWNGGVLRFSPGSPAVVSLVRGWSYPEAWGVWTVGESADITIDTGQTASDFEVSGRAVAFFRPGTSEKLVGVMANGVPVGHFEIPAGKRSQFFRLVVPRQVGSSGKLLLTFMPQDPCSPAEAGLSHDNRRLGLGLIELSVRPYKRLGPVSPRAAIYRLTAGVSRLISRLLRAAK